MTVSMGVIERDSCIRHIGYNADIIEADMTVVITWNEWEDRDCSQVSDFVVFHVIRTVTRQVGKHAPSAIAKASPECHDTNTSITEERLEPMHVCERIISRRLK
jgi:hypothetical protein